MPLFFAIAGLVSAVLALLVLCAPVLLVVLVVAVFRSARSPKRSARTPGALSPAGTERCPPSPDAAFADLIAGQWPSEVTALRERGSSGNAA